MWELQGIILAAYVLISLILPLPIKWWKRIALIPIIIFCGLKIHIYRSTGGIFTPSLSPGVILTLETLFGALFLSAAFAIAKDVLSFVHYVLRKLKVFETRPNRLYINGSILAAALGFAVYGTSLQIKAPDVVSHTVVIPNLQEGFEDFKVVQLTDLHVGPVIKGDFIAAVTEKVNELDPDLVILTGDFVDGPVSAHLKEFEAFKDLKAPIFAVTGNHEYYSGAAAWIEAFENMGIKFLQNEHIVLSREGSRLVVGGINDRRSGNTNVHKAFENAPDNTPRILLAHEPHDATRAILADFIVTGHTHGGTMIFLQPLVASYNNGFVSGLYDLGEGRSLYVSHGTGIWSGFSCRFFVPPEITLFTLKGS